LDKNYILKPNDRLRLEVFTDDGELLIDPNNELQQQFGNLNNQQNNPKTQQEYIIQVDGSILLPLINRVNLKGMTLLEAEIFLSTKYDSVYNDTFVKLRPLNRRVFLLGAPGGQVIPLENENTSLAEVIAAGGGIDFGAKSQNIKLIRGNDIYLIDLSTISGYQRTNMNVEPGDIVYVEPWRQVWLESLEDIVPILTLATSTLTLIVVIQNL
jgi:polysaccharide export outer membrane protein